MTNKLYKSEIAVDGSERWYNEDGTLHRLNGPAVIFDHGEQQCFKDGKLHRLDGPAVIYADGDREWWIAGRQCYSQQQFQVRSGVSDEEITLLVLKHGNIE